MQHTSITELEAAFNLAVQANTELHIEIQRLNVLLLKQRVLIHQQQQQLLALNNNKQA